MLHVVVEVFLWLLGLCIGSFLNVVVYRLGAGLSIHKPSRSFCPRCRVSIAWHDNIPILSWVLLRGHCRHCRAPISVQYPLVEAATGLAFVLVYHLLFVTQAWAGLPAAILPRDLPLLLSWLALAACLIACSAMDIVSYTIDVRVTNVVIGLGIVLHALWPRPGAGLLHAGTPTAAAATSAFVVVLLMLWLAVWRKPDDEPDVFEAEPEPAETPTARFAGRFGVAALVAITGWLFVAGVLGSTVHLATETLPVAAALLALFGTLVLVGGQQRPADEDIHAAIEEERPQARRAAVGELLWLLPALVVGLVMYALVGGLPAFDRLWDRLVSWSPGAGLYPAAGVAWALKGLVLGAAAGWVLRIVFTLIYGREAFGVGDIYILAAAGATAGWDIALLGLLLAVGIALAGWALGLLLKSTVMIPFGPWLALGFVAALWCSRTAHSIGAVYADGIKYAWDRQPHLLAGAGGLMLVGSAAAIALSRLVRHWVMPDEDEADQGDG